MVERPTEQQLHDARKQLGNRINVLPLSAEGYTYWCNNIDLLIQSSGVTFVGRNVRGYSGSAATALLACKVVDLETILTIYNHALTITHGGNDDQAAVG